MLKVTESVRDGSMDVLALDLDLDLERPRLSSGLGMPSLPSLPQSRAPVKTVLKVSFLTAVPFIAGSMLCFWSETNYPFFLCTKLKPQRTAENLGSCTF